MFVRHGGALGSPRSSDYFLSSCHAPHTQEEEAPNVSVVLVAPGAPWGRQTSGALEGDAEHRGHGARPVQLLGPRRLPQGVWPQVKSETGCEPPRVRTHPPGRLVRGMSRGKGKGSRDTAGRPVCLDVAS